MSAIILALISSLPATLAALATLWIAIKNSNKTDKVIEKADVIHTLVNSRMTEVQAKLDASLSRVDKLEAILAEKAK